MPAPFKPTLLTPGPRGAGSPSTITFTGRFNSFQAGEEAHEYSLRRRKLSPTVGTNEYWDGTEWVGGGGTWLAAPAELFDGDVLEVDAGAGWTNEEVWEWSLNFRNSSEEESGFATPHLLSVHPQPTLTVSLEDPATDSRPLIRWLFNGGLTRRQRSVRFALYNESTTEDGEFDPSESNWQNEAVWIMDSPVYNSLQSTLEVGIDLAVSSDYSLYYITEDDYGYSSGWLSGGTFTTNLTPPAAPSLELNRNHGDGTVQVTVASTFNLLSIDNSEFRDSLGTWHAKKNCSVEHLPDEESPAILVTMTGMLYDDMLAAHADFDAQDTAYDDYDQEGAAQSSPVGFGLLAHSQPDDEENMIPVIAGDVYSAIASIKMLDSSRDCRVRINWYDSSNDFISASDGSQVTCATGLSTPVACESKTAPALAEWAQVEIECESAAGPRFEVASVAISRSDSIEWTPGGLAVDVSFVIQKRVNNGDWIELWNASRENRLDPQNLVSTVTSVRDRSALLGVDGIQYRAFTVTRNEGNLVYSAPTVTAIPKHKEKTWWLRNVKDSSLDTAIRSSAFSIDHESKEEVVAPRRRDFSMVIGSDEAPGNTIQLTAMTVDAEEYKRLETILRGNELLYLQRNVGDGFTARRVGTVSKSQRRARDNTANNNAVRHVHDWSVSLEIVDPSEAYE